jgi:hypothetical protein
MKQFHRLRFLLAIFLLFACITPYVSAFTVSSININPQGYQAAGTPMTVNSAIDFSSEGTETFPSASELHMSTNLVDPHWVPVLVLNGVETHLQQKTGGSLIFPGWYFSYPSTERVQLKVTLKGNIPMNPSPSQNFLKIQEVDSGNNIVSTAHVDMPATPITTLSTPTKPTTTKIFTPIPTDTTTQKSPIGIEAGIIAIIGAALLVLKQK